MTEHCKNCGEGCSGRMKIRIRKNKDYIFCTSCFNYFRYFKIKEIKAALSRNKYGGVARKYNGGTIWTNF